MRIPCEVSLRHVHLSRADADSLFGKGYEFAPVRALSQTGEFLCEERIALKTPKGVIENVAIVLPLRNRTQVELSRTDCFALGLKNVPVRLSGDHESSAKLTIVGRVGEVVLDRGVIVARRHVHLDPQTAAALAVADGDALSLLFDGERGGRLDGAIARVSEKFVPAVHIDSDEANAVGFVGGDVFVQKVQ